MHHIDTSDGGKSDQNHEPLHGFAWTRLLTRYHWFVLIVAALGWLFDCLDQQLFILARPAAMEELLRHISDPEAFAKAKALWADISTSVFIAGWASGGLVFGMLGDRIGRAKTMIITILIYSLCTGLSSISQTVYDFAFYRFLTGLGVGGEFAVGVALVAEVMPSRARPYTLSMLQALSAFGNIGAALIFLSLGIAQEETAGQSSEELGWLDSPWRIMFLIGALPALLALLIRRRLKEPEQWEKASHQGAVAKQLGSYRELLFHPVWGRRALLGLVLACAGVIGLWAIGFYTPDLMRAVQTAPIRAKMFQDQIAAANAAGDAARAANLARLLQDIIAQQDPAIPKELRLKPLATRLEEAEKQRAQAAAASEQAIRLDQQIADLKPLVPLNKEMGKRVDGQLAKWQSYTSIAINVGAFFGMFGFGAVAQRIGRKKTFAIALLLACAATVGVFFTLRELWQVFVLVPIMGFCQLSLFAGYAIYFPELFPTHLRSTGTSFCYNVGRFVAAGGPLVKTYITGMFVAFPEADRFRYAGMVMCAVFLVGLVVLPFLPETKGKPLPE